MVDLVDAEWHVFFCSKAKDNNNERFFSVDKMYIYCILCTCNLSFQCKTFPSDTAVAYVSKKYKLKSVFRKSDERSGVDCVPDCLQAELNQGGGWERLCMERDPFILTGLMWSWLEQLKEPVISVQQAKDLNPIDRETPALVSTLGRVSASFETRNVR